MKLTYWVAESDDSPAYSIRRLTKKACFHDMDAKFHDAPVKVEVEYACGFDLLVDCLGEGGLMEERRAVNAAHFG